MEKAVLLEDFFNKVENSSQVFSLSPKEYECLGIQTLFALYFQHKDGRYYVNGRDIQTQLSVEIANNRIERLQPYTVDATPCLVDLESSKWEYNPNERLHFTSRELIDVSFFTSPGHNTGTTSIQYCIPLIITEDKNILCMFTQKLLNSRAGVSLVLIPLLLYLSHTKYIGKTFVGQSIEQESQSVHIETQTLHTTKIGSFVQAMSLFNSTVIPVEVPEILTDNFGNLLSIESENEQTDNVVIYDFSNVKSARLQNMKGAMNPISYSTEIAQYITGIQSRRVLMNVCLLMTSAKTSRTRDLEYCYDVRGMKVEDICLWIYSAESNKPHILITLEQLKSHSTEFISQLQYNCIGSIRVTKETSSFYLEDIFYSDRELFIIDRAFLVTMKESKTYVSLTAQTGQFKKYLYESIPSSSTSLDMSESVAKDIVSYIEDYQ